MMNDDQHDRMEKRIRWAVAILIVLQIVNTLLILFKWR